MVVFLPVQCVGGHLAYLPGLCSKKKMHAERKNSSWLRKEKKLKWAIDVSLWVLIS